MYSSKQLNSEIDVRICDLTESGVRLISAKALAMDIVARHSAIVGDDVDFYSHCSLEHVENKVRLAFNRFKLKPEGELSPDPQMTLPGFKRVQRFYAVERESDHQIIAIEDLTRAEIVGKVEELRAMGRGCYEHADELERYAQKFRRAA
jgi:hypothetical protein